MEPTSNTKKPVINLNKPAYIAFILTGIFFLIRNDISQAVMFWGLALVFDPFNIETPFTNRPFYQKIWLFVHLAITFLLFILIFLGK